jgi:hypothetical protein
VLTQFPERGVEPEVVEDGLALVTSARPPVGQQACIPPRVREVAEGLSRDCCARRPRAEPASDVLFRPEEVHCASGEDDVVPPVRGGDEAMEEQVVAIDPASVHFDRVGLPTVGAGRFDVAIKVECGEHAERVPRAVGVPPLISGVYSVCSGDGGERVGHPDLVCRRVEHQSVRVVQLPPAMLHVALVPEFRRCRRTPQLDEGGVCAIAKFDQLRVDAGTLQDSPLDSSP